MRRLILGAVAALVVVDLALLVSDTRVLILERKVNPGERYEVEEFGDAGAKAQSTLVCKYFTGRAVTTAVYWYASNNVLGRDSCPFLHFAT